MAQSKSVVSVKTKQSPKPRLKAKSSKEIAKVEENLVAEYCALVGGIRGAEWDYVLNVARALATGKTSVRNVKVSIEEAIAQSGTAPTVRASHVQYFVTLSKMVEKYPETRENKLGEMLKLSTRFQQHCGADNISDVLADTATFEEMEDGVPSFSEEQNGRRERTNAKKSEARSLGIILTQFLAEVKTLKGDALKLEAEDIKRLKEIAGFLRKVEGLSGTARK